MIRDFCGISRSRLVDEIEALRTAVNAGHSPPGVSAESVEAIDQVRSIGNIGAHMQREIDLIVEVDTGEADALIDLIETLFDEWYVARANRQARLSRVKAIAEDKKELLRDAKAKKGTTES
jgi:hypothetical protein